MTGPGPAGGSEPASAAPEGAEGAERAEAVKEAGAAREAGPPAPGAPAPGRSAEPGAPAPGRSPRAGQGETPLYKGEPLDAERGPGLGCFWIQIVLLGTLLVLTPLTVVWAWDERISAGLLILTLVLLLFAGQTVIFLLRLVAADRRSRRVPRSSAARRTVGMLEDEAATDRAETRDVPPGVDGGPPGVDGGPPEEPRPG